MKRATRLDRERSRCGDDSGWGAHRPRCRPAALTYLHGQGIAPEQHTPDMLLDLDGGKVLGGHWKPPRLLDQQLRHNSVSGRPAVHRGGQNTHPASILWAPAELAVPNDRRVPPEKQTIGPRVAVSTSLAPRRARPAAHAPRRPPVSPSGSLHRAAAATAVVPGSGGIVGLWTHCFSRRAPLRGGLGCLRVGLCAFGDPVSLPQLRPLVAACRDPPVPTKSHSVAGGPSAVYPRRPPWTSSTGS